LFDTVSRIQVTYSLRVPSYILLMHKSTVYAFYRIIAQTGNNNNFLMDAVLTKQ